MRAESIVAGVAGAVFGLLVGWIIGTQQGSARPAGAAPAPFAQAAPAGSMPPAVAAVDESRAAALKGIAAGDAANVQSRVQLGNLYFDAERYQEAIRWYDEALRLNPKDVNVSTDLAVCFYYTNQPDRAISQLEESLRIDPAHTKSLLNLGIVKSFGKQDLAGAMAAWEEVIKVAPGSEEGQSARRLLDNLRSAHPGGTAMPPPGTPAATETPKPAGSGR
ncbi:MAG TPA: tetratricopeptide repeat protein [Vicinamibacterales bacterium]|nr:tetratricopeptide repeat protein [Vicinamibacterales bacterium]HPW20096.1 tetratricopeptide repeat protein [Vicinamibacterales bacterium]